MKLNKNFDNINESYLFSTIAKKVNQFIAENKDANVIKMGIGDVTKPLAKSVVDAMTKAVAEMGEAETFRGYGDEAGYGFLRETISNYYSQKGVDLNENEIFISDGAKSDLGNILDLFSEDEVVAIPSPVYPVYVDTNLMAGRKIVYLKGNKENNFKPTIDKNEKVGIIYICSPNNPTGGVFTKEELKEYVDYANENEAVILFDGAYECFIDGDLPTSIYQIEGAKTCAIEFNSFSKMAGFTGVRCGFTCVPKEMEKLNKMWRRRQATKFNGVPYIVQRGAEAVFSTQGMKEIKQTICYYKENAKIMAETMKELGIYFTGGDNSPYIWLKCPLGMTSWEFFDFLLEKANVVGTPGVGFGAEGEGYFRLTAFNTKENTIEAMDRIKKILK